MSSPESRLGLRGVGTDDPATEFRTAINNHRDTLKRAVLYDEGPLSNRPTSTVGTPGVAGREYRALDDPTGGPNGTLYRDYGTGWVVDVERAGEDPAPTDILQQGVISGGTVTRNSASQVTVAAGWGWIKQASGLLRRVSWPATEIDGIPATPNSNGRVDQIVVNSDGVVSRLAGTDPGNASWSSLDYTQAATSRAAVPVGSMRLWEYIVNTTGVVATAGSHFRDRRVHAKGARVTAVHSGADLTRAPDANGGYVPLVSGLARRLEVGPGNGLRLRILGQASVSATPATISFGVEYTGQGVPNFGGSGAGIGSTHRFAAESNQPQGWNTVLDGDVVWSAGSFLLRPVWASPTATARLQGGRVMFIAEEIIDFDRSNGTV